MSERETHHPQQSEFLKDQQDRVAVDSETVGQILNPHRTAETVRFPDPSIPRTESATESETPQSMAEMVMARRTDAGRREPAGDSRVSRMRTTVSLVLGIAFLVLVIAVFGWLWGH